MNVLKYPRSKNKYKERCGNCGSTIEVEFNDILKKSRNFWYCVAVRCPVCNGRVNFSKKNKCSFLIYKHKHSKYNNSNGDSNLNENN